MVADIKLYASLGVSGVLFEGETPVQTADLHQMRSWVFGQLSWDASRHGEGLIQEFLVNSYSAGAAGFIMQHMKAYTDEVTRIDYYVTVSDSATAAYFSPQVIYTSLTSLDKAMANCTAASETLPRDKVVKEIAVLRVSPWFLALSNWASLCNWTKIHALPWPLEASLHASLATFRSNVTGSLGAATLETEAAALAAMNSSKDLSCTGSGSGASW